MIYCNAILSMGLVLGVIAGIFVPSLVVVNLKYNYPEVTFKCYT